MSVRAYDPTLGRFISRDPLGRAPLMGWSDQPYAYAGNNPLVNVDPSGQMRMGLLLDGGQVFRPAQRAAPPARVQTKRGGPGCDQNCRGLRKKAQLLETWGRVLDGLTALLGLVQVGIDVVQLFQDWNTAGGIDKTIGLAVDTVSIIADLASAGVGVLAFLSHWMNVSGWPMPSMWSQP